MSDDKPHEECGVFGIYAPGQRCGAPYLLCPLCPAAPRPGSGRYRHLRRPVAHVHKGMGLVSQVFNEENLHYLQGDLAIGHTRYSTTGAPKLRNTQPYVIETLEGPLAIAPQRQPDQRAPTAPRTAGTRRRPVDVQRQRSDPASAGRCRQRRLCDAYPHHDGQSRRRLCADDPDPRCDLRRARSVGLRPLVLVSCRTVRRRCGRRRAEQWQRREMPPK